MLTRFMTVTSVTMRGLSVIWCSQFRCLCFHQDFSMSISSLLSSGIVCSWSWNSLMLPILQECLLFHFAGPCRSIMSPFLMYLFVLQLSHESPASQLCNVFAFPGSYQWCCRSCLSLHLIEMSLAHILERSSVGICLLCIWLVMLRRNSQRILLLCCLSISCLRGNLHLLVHCRPQSGTAGGHFVELWNFTLFFGLLRAFSSSSSSCTCSSFSNVLTLYVAIFSRSPLVSWFFSTQRFVAPPVCSIGEPEPPPRSQTSMLLGTGGIGLFVLCMLVFVAYLSTLANAGWKEVPKLECQA